MELEKNVSELEAVSRGRAEEIVFPCVAGKLNLEHSFTRALRSEKAKVVKAEMVTPGGRYKSVLWVQGLCCGNEGITMLKRALKVVIQTPMSQG
ncbi:Transcription factor-like protein [Quillaja saponaria]|uniref:Transcription factor-like protein n=1 Tax=Quillaja saponaria TaxID=32244 RepID=A0AAD7KRN4_QUISA|nr:Transcription factor-like protein [Quillaja saponaria]